jgi:hypothetical protein
MGKAITFDNLPSIIFFGFFDWFWLFNNWSYLLVLASFEV